MVISAVTASVPLLHSTDTLAEAARSRAPAAAAAASESGRTGDAARSTAHQEFETFVLQSFIEAMLPDEAVNVFGKGTAGAIWKSMLAEQLAGDIVRSGQVRLLGERDGTIPAPAPVEARQVKFGTPADLSVPASAPHGWAPTAIRTVEPDQ